MKFLLEIPFVMSLADWVWLENEADNVTPEICVGAFPLMSSDCWSALVAKGLGIAIILGACLNKAPLIYNIWTSKSTQGLSAGGLYGEVMVLANSACYGILMKYPFTAYGETIALLAQSLVVVALQWIFAKPPVASMEKVVAVGVIVIYIVGVSTFLPAQFYYILMASLWPLLLYAKGAQIYESFRVKHTGAQAIITIVMNLVGSSLRVLTTLQEVGWDMAFLTGSLLSVGLNGIMLLQYFAYRTNTEEFLRNLEKQKTD